MATQIPKPPVHPLSALATFLIDGLGTLLELGATTTVVGAALVPVIMVLSGAVCFALVAAVERFVSRQSWSRALILGAAVSLLTALPYLCLGGLAGGIALGWAGLYELGKPSRLPEP